MTCFLPTNQAWRYWSLETFLSDVASLGAMDVDLWLCNQHVNIDAHDAYNAVELEGVCRRYGVRVRTLTPEQSNPKAYNIASTDRLIQRLTFGYYQQIVRLCSRLGTRRISINGGWFPLDGDAREAWEATAAMLGRICRCSAEEGIDICLEPLTKTPYRLVTSLDDLVRMEEEVREENLRITLDTGTIARNGEELSDYLVAFGPRVGYVHLTNLSPSVSSHLAWGDPDGVLDSTEILATLRDVGYEGECALEMNRSSYFQNPRESLARSLCTLKGCER